MVDEGTEESEKGRMEMSRFQMQVEDTRKEKDPGQQFALTEGLRADEVDLALLKAKRFLGVYSSVEPNNLSVRIVDGRVGEGTIQGAVIEVQLSPRGQAIAEMKSVLGPILEEVQVEDRDAKSEEIVLALFASTVLHEGVHCLINSRPDSLFARDFEEVSGIENENGEISTLLDEGIAYAVQGIYAPVVEPLGSLAPSAKETDSDKVRLRKDLGEKLRPKVKEYFDHERVIDNEFFSFAASAMKDLGVAVA